MTATDADRAKAAELVTQIWWAGAVRAPSGPATEHLAAALAEARAEAAKLRADMRALADTLDAEAREYEEEADQLPTSNYRRSGLLGRILGKRVAAARLRALADGRQ